MPKFNKELFRGLDSLKAEQTEEPTLKVGAGLLNDKSKNASLQYALAMERTLPLA